MTKEDLKGASGEKAEKAGPKKMDAPNRANGEMENQLRKERGESGHFGYGCNNR